MKITIVNALGPGYGSTYRARLLYRIAKAQGREVTYLESNSDLASPDVVSIRQPPGVWGFFSAILDRAWRVGRIKGDLCLIQKASPLTFLCFLTARLRSSRVILDWDDLDSEFQPTRLRKLLTRATEALIPALCDCITTHNRYLERHIRGITKKPVVFLPQVIDTVALDPVTAVADPGMTGKKREGFRIVAHLCTFTEGGARDAGYIIKAFALAASRMEKLHLLLIGGGSLQPRIEKMIREAGITGYTITGLVSQRQVAGYLASADLCLVYMRDDLANRMRMSLKTLEYLAMDKPVAGVLTGETKDSVGNLCRLARDGDVGAFAELIVDSLARPGKQASRAAIAAVYSPEAVGGILKELLDEHRTH